MGLLKRIAKRFWDAVDGLKTYIATAAFVLLGLAEYFDVITLRPLLNHFLGEDTAGLVVVLLPVVFAGLRYLTKSAPKPVPSSVDVPEGEG